MAPRIVQNRCIIAEAHILTDLSIAFCSLQHPEIGCWQEALLYIAVRKHSTSSIYWTLYFRTPVVSIHTVSSRLTRWPLRHRRRTWHSLHFQYNYPTFDKNGLRWAREGPRNSERRNPNASVWLLLKPFSTVVWGFQPNALSFFHLSEVSVFTNMLCRLVLFHSSTT